MNTSLNRRHFLRGTGALIALPTLESIGFRRFASAEASVLSVPSKRAVFLGIPTPQIGAPTITFHLV